MFCRPSNLWVAVALPDNGDNGVAFICTGPAGRVLHSSTASDGTPMVPTYQYIAGTHTFYQLSLASCPKEVAEKAQKAASEDIAAAYSRLMFLNFTDSGYAALNKLYGQANAEYFLGRNAMNLALLKQGNESLKLFSRAVTAFTHSQAHAQQVYEALVPPPTSPSDLGLKPFGGDWASWETKVGQKK